MSFKNRGVRAQKSFFLLGDDDVYLECLQQIGDSFLNGIITAVSRKGHSEYEIWWDTSALSFPIDEDNVHKDDVELVKKLKISHTVFDEKYPVT